MIMGLLQMPAYGSDQIYVQQAKETDKVMFNINSRKYHIPSCSAARRCTHCIETTRREAKEKGGVPCKLCGAGE
jgi:hypothetical protein